MPYYAPAAVTEIANIPTAEIDTALILAPDGAGAVEWRAEVGGTGLILEAHHLVTSGEILTLHSAPVELVAAVAGKLYTGIAARFIYNAGATPYTLAAGSLHVNRGTAGDYIFTTDNQILTEANDQVVEIPPGPFANVYQYLPDVSGASGALALYSADGTNPSAGDGTLDVRVLYRVTDV